MLIERTKVTIKSVKAKKEGSIDVRMLRSDVEVEFDILFPFMDRLVPDQRHRFSQNFWDDNGNRRLEQLFPIRVHRPVHDLLLRVYFGKQPTTFTPAMMLNICMTPIDAGYVSTTATFRVYPSAIESGKLDNAHLDVLEIEADFLNTDIEDAGPEATDD